MVSPPAGFTPRTVPHVTGRRGLSQADYVDAAVACVNEHGAAGFTARALGEQLGVDPTAVYRHFPSLNDLASAVLDRVFGEIIAEPLTGRSARARLTSRLTSMHRAFLAQPNLLGLFLTSTGVSPNANRMTAQGLEMLAELGLEGENLVVCYQMLESLIIGSHLYDLAGSPHHLSGRRARLRGVDHPVLDRSYPNDKAVEQINNKAAEAALEALLDYCEALAAKSAGKRKKNPTKS